MRRDEALALLTAAYDVGIRHFDTAPLYGWGAAEELLGAFATGRSDLCIVTKAGIAPPSKLSRLIAKAPGVAAARPVFGQFKPGQVSRSFERSLSRLKIEQVGALLLHEATPEDVNDELIAELARHRQSGKAAKLGLATSPAHTAAILRRYPDTFDIVQIPADGLQASGPPRRQTVLHSVLGKRMRAAAKIFAADPALSRDLGIAPGDLGAVAQCLLRVALAESGGGVVLFSSTRPETIHANAQLTPADPATCARVAEALANRAMA